MCYCIQCITFACDITISIDGFDQIYTKNFCAKMAETALVSWVGLVGSVGSSFSLLQLVIRPLIRMAHKATIEIRSKFFFIINLLIKGLLIIVLFFQAAKVLLFIDTCKFFLRISSFCCNFARSKLKNY